MDFRTRRFQTKLLATVVLSAGDVMKICRRFVKEGLCKRMSLRESSPEVATIDYVGAKVKSTTMSLANRPKISITRLVTSYSRSDSSALGATHRAYDLTIRLIYTYNLLASKLTKTASY